jgi:hypothetical protein
METVCVSETLASTDESPQLQNPEGHHPHRRENLRTHKENSVYASMKLLSPGFIQSVIIQCLKHIMKVSVLQNLFIGGGGIFFGN